MSICNIHSGLNLEQYYTPLLAFAIRLSKSEHDAEDLVQQTFQSACMHTARFPNEKMLRSWLYTTLYHKFIDLNRKKYRKDLYFGSLSFYVVTSSEERPDNAAERKDLNLMLRQWLEILNPFTRQIIQLMYLDGFTSREVSVMFEIPIVQVKSIKHHGIQKLRKHYLHMQSCV